MRRLSRWRVGAIATVALACAGCSSTAPNDLTDVDRVRNEMLDVAERDIPVIAADLDATVVSAGLWAEYQGGAEGTSYNIEVKVPGSMDGTKPSQGDLEQALKDAGYTDVGGPGSLYTSEFDDPSATGSIPDGVGTLGVTYNSDPRAKYPYDFIFVSNELLTITHSNGEKYREDDDHRGFDQSLVTSLDG